MAPLKAQRGRSWAMFGPPRRCWWRSARRNSSARPRGGAAPFPAFPMGFSWENHGKTMGKHGKTEASTWILWKILGILEKLWKTDGLKLFEHQNGHGWRFKDRLTCLLLVLIMMNHDSSGIFIDDHGFRWLKQAISCQISSVWWIKLRMMFGGFIKKWMNMAEPRNLLPSTVHAQF